MFVLDGPWLTSYIHVVGNKGKVLIYLSVEMSALLRKRCLEGVVLEKSTTQGFWYFHIIDYYF